MQAEEFTPSPDRVMYRNKGIDHNRTIELAEMGLTHSEIASIQGCDRSNISHTLERYEYESDTTAVYKENRADLFAWMQHRFISSITTEEIKKMQPGQRIVCAGILFDKEQLIRGLPTSINMTVLYDVLGTLRGKQAPGDAP